MEPLMVGDPLIMLDIIEPVMEAPDEGTAVGMSERVTPAAAQREETAGARLEISLCSHRSGAQVRSEFSMAERPLVHWQFVSVTPQLELGRAATKQGIAHWGIPLKS